MHLIEQLQKFGEDMYMKHNTKFGNKSKRQI